METPMESIEKEGGSDPSLVATVPAGACSLSSTPREDTPREEEPWNSSRVTFAAREPEEASGEIPPAAWAAPSLRTGATPGELSSPSTGSSVDPTTGSADGGAESASGPITAPPMGSGLWFGSG